MKTQHFTFIRHAGRIAAVVVVLIGGISLFIYARFQGDMTAQRARIAAGSRMAETPCGLIGYGEAGSGIPVLVIHGSGGGYDQGLRIGESLGDGLRVIAPSRFGYLNAPYPADASVTAQADAYVCLLDYLGIEKAAVIAVSAGGTSGLQLAQNHPERVESLMMVSAVSNVRPVREADETTQAVLLTDFVYWAADAAIPDRVMAFFGLSNAAQAQLAPEELERVRTLLEEMNPLEMRLKGLEHDSTESNLFDGAVFNLEQITAPTLVIHAADDSFIPLVHAHYTADHIPGAELVVYDFGGHFVAGRSEAIATIRSFIQRSHEGSN